MEIKMGRTVAYAMVLPIFFSTVEFFINKNPIFIG